MITARRLHHRYEDYLRSLEVSGVKLEYCEGEIYAMAGGTPARADLAASAIRLLGNALGGDCRVSSSDLKVRVEATDLSTFPDATVVCGERRVSAVDPNAVTNPTVLVEVTSVTVVERTAEGFRQTEVRSGESVVLTNPVLRLAVDELYAGIELGSK